MDTNAGDLLRVILDNELSNNINSHHIKSVNTFYSTGINQIATDTFQINVEVLNERDTTDVDKEIEKIFVDVVITNIMLNKPNTRRYKSSNNTPLTPFMARMNNLTYSSPLRINAKITATAYKKSGETIVKSDEIKNFRISGVPTMVRSKLCNTYKLGRQALLDMKEDPTDPGGYFIIKGNEWTLDNQENIKYNEFRVYHNVGHKNELARGEIISKPGDSFENSSEIIMTLLTNNQLVCKMINRYMLKEGTELELPFYTIFRILGVTRDDEMIKHIVYDLDTDIGQRMQITLENSLRAAYPQLPDARVQYTQNDNILYLSKHVDAYEKQYNELNEIIGDAEQKLTRKQYIITTILQTFDRYFLPHIGITKESRLSKARFFGYLIHKLLLVEMDIIESTDRDSYASKRVHPPGVSYSKAFKTQYNFAFVKSVKSAIRSELKSTQFTNIYWAQVIKQSINGTEFEKALVQAITSSDAKLKINQKVFSNHLTAQQLHRKNPLNVISTLRQVTSPNTSSSKSSDRADEMRRVHPSGTGYICVVQSADTGEKVGMQKQMAISATITSAGFSYILKQKILNDPLLIQLEKVSPVDLERLSLGKIMVNGEWIGVTQDSPAFVKKYRDLRRSGEIDRHTSIQWDYRTDEIILWVDVGRIIRPLLIVYSTNDPYPGNDKKGKKDKTSKKSTGFKQGIKITNTHLRDLYAKRISNKDLVEAGIIEYITPEEQQRLFLAKSYKHLLDDKHNPLRPYTHCEIPQAILGLAALTSPFAQHNQLARVVYQTNQVKQTCSWFALNWKFRADKETFLQYHAESPLVRTMANNYINPCGGNLIVAIMFYGGYNQEDSIIFNASAVRRGLFGGSYFSNEKTELDRNEEFASPNIADTADIKSNANYEKLRDGMISVGEVIEKGDVIIGKRMKVDDDEYPYVDRSIVYNGSEPAIVENVIVERDQNDTQICKVSFRNIRNVTIGDKFSSRAGQKGVCGILYNQEDMPLTENGVVPSIIFNPHSIPSRMTIGQLIEGITAKVCGIEGIVTDGTMFSNVDIDAIGDRLEALGFNRHGEETLYNGQTGEKIETSIFIVPTYYQRLQKFVADAMYAVSAGPTCAITRQPIGGKASGGGLRLGEMERDVLVANGALSFLKEKFMDHSDGFTWYVCTRCGSRDSVIVNESRNTYKCKKCNDLADIVRIPSSVSSKLFSQEVRGMNIGMRWHIQPPTFEENE